ncbi:MAG TPA: hypothetical protein VGI77_00460 [Gaiellaceae bacterium]|jgi:hypothetical protein
MLRFVPTAGEVLAIESMLPWVDDLVREGLGGEFGEAPSDEPTLEVTIETDRRAFPTDGFELVARGAWRRRGEVVLENVCTSGFDLHVADAARPRLTYRWRPPRRERLAAAVLRSRFHLVARAALLQYPALWSASARGRAPLHASGCTVGERSVLLVAHSGVGRSTLLLDALAAGSRSTGDNLGVGDGERVWGMVEPLRVDSGGGRRMAHGRRERPFPNRVSGLVPEAIIVVERGVGDTRLEPRDGGASVVALVSSTYAAGELQRFWAFTALLASGLGGRSAHPPVEEVARRFAADLPSYTLSIGRTRPNLAHMLDHAEVPA